MPSEYGGYTVVGFCLGFPGGSEVKVPACYLGDLGSVPGLGRFPGEGNGNPLQYSCLENPMDRGAWWATVHGVTKSQTQLSDFTFFSFVQRFVMFVVIIFRGLWQQFSWCWRCLSDSQWTQTLACKLLLAHLQHASYCSQLCWDPLAHLVVLLGKCSLQMNYMPPIPSIALVEDSGIHQWMHHLPQVQSLLPVTPNKQLFHRLSPLPFSKWDLDNSLHKPYKTSVKLASSPSKVLSLGFWWMQTAASSPHPQPRVGCESKCTVHQKLSFELLFSKDWRWPKLLLAELVPPSISGMDGKVLYFRRERNLIPLMVLF